MDRECKINLLDTCEVCDDQLPLSSGVYGPHPHPSVYIHVDNEMSCPCMNVSMCPWDVHTCSIHNF